ncbi:hypothetical protein A2W24_05695 [Microgenomates group bacterium RBG_16_45_19]|nr:MAG: hypothetical protein A2W24_05695 [Microgenomates group bacterium RBG_16_45_19]
MSVTSWLNSTGVRQSAILTGGNVVSTFISALALILLSRILGPAAYGAFSVAFALSMLTTKIFDFGLNLSLQKYLSQAAGHSRLKVHQLVTYGFRIKLLGSGAILLAAFGLTVPLSHALHLSDQLAIIFLGIALGLIIYWFDFVAYLFQSLSAFSLTAVLAMVQAATKLLVILSLILAGVTSAAITYLAYGLAPLTGLGLGLIKLKDRWHWQPGLSSPARSALWRLTRYTAMLTIAQALTDYLDIILVQNLTDQYQTGLYAAAARIGLLLAVVAFSINSVMNTRAAKYTDPQVLRRYQKKALSFAGFSLFSLVILLPLSPWLLYLTAGPAYLLADPALKYLLTAGVVMIATAPLAAVFYGLDFPLYFALVGVTQVVVLVGFSWYLIPVWGIVGAGQARLLMRVVVLGVTLLCLAWVRRPAFRYVNT